MQLRRNVIRCDVAWRLLSQMPSGWWLDNDAEGHRQTCRAAKKADQKIRVRK